LKRDVKDFTIGEDIRAEVVLRVMSISIHENTNGPTDGTVGCVVAKMNLGDEESSEEEKAEKLYGK
jgi:hypothetical protein